MNSIICKSPTRVDLAGGTLDLWPLYLLVGGAYTINVAIDINTTVQISPRKDGVITLKSIDQNCSVEYPSIFSLLSDEQEQWSLVRHHVKYWHPKQGFDLITQSESPVGGGLGGSSSLSISLIKAFSQFCNKRFSPAEMVELAGNVEAQVLKTPTGTQDYYPPLFGGINIITYSCEGRSVEVHDIPEGVFEGHFFLVYTGHPHHSGLNNWSIMKNAIDKNEKTLKSLKELSEIAVQVKRVCEEGNWHRLGELLKQEFAARVRLSPAVTSKEIEKLEAVALGAGAEAVKICGAGGGGCVMVWTSPNLIEKVKEACRNAGFQVIKANPVQPLAKANGELSGKLSARKLKTN